METEPLDAVEAPLWLRTAATWSPSSPTLVRSYWLLRGRLRASVRVFVLTTGRTGSTSFIRACSHATNYTAGHESRVRDLLPDRLRFPDGHIEADNRLFFYLGLLDEAFGEEAFYVHLTRNHSEVERSYLERWADPVTLGRGWAQMVMLSHSIDKALRPYVVRDAVAAMNAGIRLFLKDKPHQITVAIEDCPDAFFAFWDAIGAEGDRDAAGREWAIPRNANQPGRAEKARSQYVRTRLRRSIGLRR